MTLDPNDPKLTAYVLGELDDAQREAVEADLADSAELREAAAEIRRAAELLTEGLRAEPSPSLTPEQREAVLAEGERPDLPAVIAKEKPRRRRRLVLSLAAAACVLLAAGVALYSVPMIRHDRADREVVAWLAHARSRAEDARPPAGVRLAGPGDAEIEEPVEEPMSLTIDDPFGSGQRAVEGGGSDAPTGRPSAATGSPAVTPDREGIEFLTPQMGGYDGPVIDGDRPILDFRRTRDEEADALRRVSRMTAGDIRAAADTEMAPPVSQHDARAIQGEARLADEAATTNGDGIPDDVSQQYHAERSHTPAPDGPPIVYPNAEEWRRLSERRATGGERSEPPAEPLRMTITPRVLVQEEEEGSLGVVDPGRSGANAPNGDAGAQGSATVGLQQPGVFSGDVGLRGKEDGQAVVTGTGNGLAGQTQVEVVPRIDMAVIGAHGHNARRAAELEELLEQRAQRTMDTEGPVEKSGQPGDRAADTAGDRSGGGEQGGGQAARVVGSGKPEKDEKKPVPKPAPPTTWRRAKAMPNASRLSVGDQKDLPLEGMQANVTIDGFRARVLLDYYFYNDGDQQYEGTFKLRLPNDASLYFFAFGESVYRYRPDQKKDVRGAFLTVAYSKPDDSLPDEILKLRADSWNTPKVARMVPREKAAFAYRQTVRRRVDPALVEWSGAGIFSARVFPLAPKKLHRIVVGYDVDLAAVDGGREYQLDLPEVPDCTVDLNLTTWAGGKARITPDVKPFMSNGRACYHFADLPKRQLRVRLENPGTVLLTGADEKTGDYFATRFRPELPDDGEGTCASSAVFLLDTSLSSNPDKFNVWLKLLQAVLTENRDSLKRFAVLAFNVEAHWWQERFVENTPENVEKLAAYANTLSLEGATDLEEALREAASPSWLAGDEKIEPWDVFLLSDGALNWGQTNLYVLADLLTGSSSHAGALFAYQTGMAGTEGRVLDHLARESGGAVFAVIGESELKQVARAHRKRPWQLGEVKLEGASDLLLAGRPKTLFPGQELLLVGRGKPGENAEVVLNLHRNGQNKEVRVKPDRVIESELAPRLYGQVAVGQLEALDEATEDVATSYARHFRVTGQTCSLLMLDSEADYQRFEIKPEDDAFVVTSSSAATVIANALDQAGERLLNAKAAFQAWLTRLEKMPGARFSLSPAVKLAVESLPREAFEVRTRPLACKQRTWEGISSELKEKLSVGQVDYDAVAAEADRRMKEYGEADALRAYSSLVEHSPGDLALVRDVAYTALAWGLPDQAYHLLRRVALARPYEPQTYLALAQSLADSGHADLAIFYYEIALGGTWDNRFQDFRRIAGVDYLHLLRKIAAGKEKVHLEKFAAARLESLESEIALKSADLVVTVLWNTDATDVDLHVLEPTGEECFYQNRSTKIGGQLTPDCTQGFGPEMYTLAKARPGKYDVRVQYFASDQNRAGTRTKVFATIYEGWGGQQERAIRKAVVLAQSKETHEVATVGIEK